MAGCLGGPPGAPCRASADGCPTQAVPVDAEGAGAEPEANTGPGRAEPRAPPETGEAGPHIAAPAAMRLENCTGTVGSFQANRTAVSSMLPPGFAPRGLTDATATVVFEALACERVTTNDDVLTSQALFHLLALLDVADAEDSPANHSRFKLLTLASSPELALALSALGLSSVQANLQVTGAGTSPSMALAWRFQSDAIRIELESVSSGGTSGGASKQWVYWFSNATQTSSLDVSKSFRYDAGLGYGGVMRASGLHPAAGVLGPLGTAAWTGQTYAHDAEVWRSSARLDGAGSASPG